jgi:hypothetical protein
VAKIHQEKVGVWIFYFSCFLLCFPRSFNNLQNPTPGAAIFRDAIHQLFLGVWPLFGKVGVSNSDILSA